MGVDIYANRAEAELITPRTDHAAIFRERYGPVVTRVIATELTSLYCSEADYFRQVEDGLEIHWTSGGSAKLELIEVAEYEDRVEVGVVERVHNGFNTADARPEQHVVPLSAPLGSRRVIDMATWRRLPQRGS